MIFRIRLIWVLAVVVVSWSVSESWARPIDLKAYQREKGNVQTRGKVSGKTVKVTLTTYWAKGAGTDKWTRRMMSSTGQRLQPGVSVAADPRIFPYGSVIEIEGVGRRVVKDTGRHVVARLASRKRGVNYPVIDLFFLRREDALRFARSHPGFAQVRIISYGNRS
jgi:3D (Asp-Asp-Asp) domain-containing protein